MHWKTILCCALTGLAARSSFGCTDVMLPQAGTDWVSMRTMDYPIPLHSEVIVEPQGQNWTSVAPEQSLQAVSWTNQYGFVGINALGVRQYPEAMNEKGLSVATLVLPGTQYCCPDGKKEVLEICDIGAFLAGQCATVSEARALLQKVDVWGMKHPLLGEQIELHVVVHDAEGRCLVVEWVGGQAKVHEDPIGVCTNAPELPAQWANLNHYAALSPKNVPGWTAPEANGSGMRGLPGDATSASRFVRMAVLKRHAPVLKDGNSATQLASHWMGLVWTPKGMIDSKASMYTQWGVVRDHSKAQYSLVSDSHRCLRTLDLKKLDFSAGAKRRVWDLNCGPQTIDLMTLPAKG